LQPRRRCNAGEIDEHDLSADDGSRPPRRRLGVANPIQHGVRAGDGAQRVAQLVAEHREKTEL
jgi:hypothetical protein